jgi:CDP-glycerol glycerophosphotransferase (TagB/SpsB family)
MPRIIEAMLYFFSGFSPRRKRKILFGAWHGKKFSDNPKYLLLHLAKQGKCFDLVWIGNEEVRVQIPDDLPIRFVRKDSWAAKWEMLTAKTVFVTHANTDIGKKNLMRGACRVYLGHGLAIKHMGAPDNPLKNPIINTIRKAVRNVFSFRYYSASSKAHHIKLLKEYAISNATGENIRHWGQPRIDYLIENSTPSARTKLREQYFEKYDVPTEGKIITYLPTFRDKGVPAFSFCELDAKQHELLDKVISENAAIILEKSHFAEAPNKKKGDRPKQKERRSLGSNPITIHFYRHRHSRATADN